MVYPEEGVTPEVLTKAIRALKVRVHPGARSAASSRLVDLRSARVSTHRLL